MTSRLRLNLLANFAGRIWTALSVYAFVPFYIRYLGVEQYGVVAFYAVLIGLFGFANFGLSATLHRELARLSVVPGGGDTMRTTARTLEVVFRWIGLAVAGIVITAAPWIAKTWVQTDSVAAHELTTTIRLMGVALGLRFPTELCWGGLSGLQHQVLSNGLRAAFGALRGFGALLVLAFVEPTVEAFFSSQVLVNVAEAVAARQALWWRMPRGERVHFKSSVFRGIWKYAAGLSGISLLSIVFTQLDKLVVSKVLGLEQFAQYSVAALASRLPLVAAGPVDEAFAPRLTQLVSLKSAEITDTYHRACQMVSLVVIPPSLLFVFHSEALLTLWTQNAALATATATPATLLVLGAACVAFQMVPFRLALAHGWTSLSLKISFAALTLFVPTLFSLTNQFQLDGAAMSWLLLHVFVAVPFTTILHSRVLPPGATFAWLTSDLGAPLLAGTCMAVVTQLLTPGQGVEELIQVGFFALAGTLILLAVVVATPASRCWLANRLHPDAMK